MSFTATSYKASTLPKTTKAIECPVPVPLVQGHERAKALAMRHPIQPDIEGFTAFTKCMGIDQPYQRDPKFEVNYNKEGVLCVMTRFQSGTDSPCIQYIVRELTPFKHGKICIKSKHHSDVTISLDKSNAREMCWDGGNFMHTVQVELNKWSGQEQFLDFSLSYRNTRSR